MIYQRYLKAFKKGVYNYIKEEPNPVTQEMIPKKYFSGGVSLAMTRLNASSAMIVTDKFPMRRVLWGVLENLLTAVVDISPSRPSTQETSGQDSSTPISRGKFLAGAAAAAAFALSPGALAGGKDLDYWLGEIDRLDLTDKNIDRKIYQILDGLNKQKSSAIDEGIRELGFRLLKDVRENKFKALLEDSQARKFGERIAQAEYLGKKEIPGYTKKEAR